MTATAEERITALARTIPCLRHRRDIDPFDPQSLDAWATSGASGGEKTAVRFILTIYNQHHPWACGRFDLFEAYGRCDETTWKVIQAWVQNPYML